MRRRNLRRNTNDAMTSTRLFAVAIWHHVGRSQDVIKAEIEAETAEGDVRRQGEQKAAEARLNALIGRPSLAPLAAPTELRSSSLSAYARQALGRSANPMRRWLEREQFPRPNQSLPIKLLS